jgi:murein L,D-transpeptidase YcbB/YkuD
VRWRTLAAGARVEAFPKSNLIGYTSSMSGTRTASFLLSLGWLAVGPAVAQEPQAPASPAAAVEDARAAPLSGAPASVDPGKANPPAADEARAVPDAGSSAVAADVPPPDVPAVAVVVTPTDGLSGAIALRLADGVALGPARLPRQQGEAIAAFYALGAFKPVWIADGAFSPAARALLARLQAAGEDALDPADYAVSLPGKTALDLADAELELSAAAVLYARDARGARLDPARLNNLLTPKLTLPAADEVLTRVAAARDPGAALAAFQPPHAGYRALKHKLAEIRTGGGVDDAGGKSSKVAPERLEAEIAANMERWRWLPPDLGRRHIFVNVPDFKLKVMDNGAVVHETRVIVGKPETPTPVFSDEMDHVIVNPSWYVPPSIFRNEFGSDPYYAASRGYQVVRGKDGSVSIRQPPGERNALGFIKFMFPNQHAVYLHDTPNRNLFGSERRAFSHGCVRVDQPFRLVDHVFAPDEGWSEDRLRAMIGKGEKTIRLREKLPVHLAYFTASVDERGTLRLADDIYGHSRRVRMALGSSGETAPVAVAEAKPRPKPKPVVAAARPRVRQPVEAEAEPLVEPAPPVVRMAAARPVARARRPAEVAAVRPPPEVAVARPAFNPFWWFTRGN